MFYQPRHKVVSKAWGSERWLTNEAEYCGKILTLQPGHMCSKHYHRNKAESFSVLEGWVRVEVWPEVGKEGPPERLELIGYGSGTLCLPPLTPHRFWAMINTAKMIEVSTHHEDSDSYRLEESRVTTRSYQI
jgi:D-lyxose ketol-isomerase